MKIISIEKRNIREMCHTIGDSKIKHSKIDSCSNYASYEVIIECDGILFYFQVCEEHIKHLQKYKE